MAATMACSIINQVLRDGRNRIKITFCSLRSIISNNSLRCLLSQVRGLSEDRDQSSVCFRCLFCFNEDRERWGNTRAKSKM